MKTSSTAKSCSMQICMHLFILVTTLFWSGLWWVRGLSRDHWAQGIYNTRENSTHQIRGWGWDTGCAGLQRRTVTWLLNIATSSSPTHMPATIPFPPRSIPFSISRMKGREWCAGKGQRKCFLTVTDKLEGEGPSHVCMRERERGTAVYIP